ncbi:5-formyltetrahydrofolate cyclo-ligase [Oceanobacillus sp. 143]|uniref:5-formyltetrahydrofolate cyclo-ligase n=1 Tax=Oceanobacillus zhaokaii TaxID=2052660 RepID=A0A345PEY7_9BACI|nr:5-formyltetrahydrofolate cyclo-ligase [Oceanobacillus zhaokaii]AXI08567.1 5-formyltetrahydrofolate cyclo-ligase [Oceanobacillus zhaokaii]QGS68375.1 5-formyltetrahydrofolate cyclo-ligase [Oceanobacillus sp. 143]
MQKSELRKEMISKLENLAVEKKQEIEAQLAENLFQSEAWQGAKSIGITISQGMEWNTQPIIEKAWEQEKVVYVPKCLPKEKKLVFYRFQSYDELEIVYYNLQEPKANETLRVEKEQIDLLLVPGLIFDERGYRIGFGGGYYDRFLTDFPNQTISLAAAFQLINQVPKEVYDIPVEQIITEKTSQ